MNRNAFIGEDDLQTFEGWLRYQAVDGATSAPDKLEEWRRIFEDVHQRPLTSPKVGMMKLKRAADQHLYAVAVEEGSVLWLALWVRRSPRGEFFVMLPRSDRDWDVHTSYHKNGNLHMKSYGRMVLSPMKRQPLRGDFRGTVDLGTFAGYGPKGVGAICDRPVFSGVVTVPFGVLGPRHGGVKVDLVEPGHKPTGAFPSTGKIIQQTFSDVIPWIVITVGSFE